MAVFHRVEEDEDALAISDGASEEDLHGLTTANYWNSIDALSQSFDDKDDNVCDVVKPVSRPPETNNELTLSHTYLVHDAQAEVVDHCSIYFEGIGIEILTTSIAFPTKVS